MPRALKRHTKWYYLCYATGIVLIFTGLALGRIWNTPWLIAPFGFGGVALWFSGLLAAGLLGQRDIRRVRSLGGQVCTMCLYDLAALPTSGHCPECGTPYNKPDVVRQWRQADRSYQAAKLYTFDDADE